MDIKERQNILNLDATITKKYKDLKKIEKFVSETKKIPSCYFLTNLRLSKRFSNLKKTVKFVMK